MTTNTTQGRAARPGAVTEHPIASQAPPGVAALHTAAQTDLESRIKERRTELINKIGVLRADKRREATESRVRLQAKLSDLAHMIKWGVADGWANLSVPLTNKLEQWLAESAPQPIATNDQP